MVRKFKKEEPIPNLPITQSSLFTGGVSGSSMSYDEAFILYSRIANRDEDIESRIFLKFKDGVEIPVTITSISNRITIGDGKSLTLIDEGKGYIVELCKTKRVPFAFLKAMAFIPCKDQTFRSDFRVQFKDGNHKNLHLKNLMWVKYL